MGEEDYKGFKEFREDIEYKSILRSKKLADGKLFGGANSLINKIIVKIQTLS